MAIPRETTEAPLKVIRGKKKQAKKWLWPSVFVVVLILAFLWWTKSHANSGNSGLITTTVTRGDLVETVSATGSVEAQTGAEVTIGPQITGVIKRLYTDVGKPIKKGDLIAELDLPDLQATYDASVANLRAAQTKAQQDESGLSQERVTTKQALATAEAGVVSANWKLKSAQAALVEQQTGTPTDIRKAQTALDGAKAALATAKAAQVQTQAGANLQIQTAQEQLTQAKANAANSSANLKRNLTLYQQGFIAATTYDQAKDTDTVNQSLVSAAQENVTLTQQKITADLETATDEVNQAAQTVYSAQAALVAAKAETNTTAQRVADVKDAQAAVDQANQALTVAKANLVNDTLYDQTIAQAKDAASSAQQAANYNEDEVQKSFIRSPISGTVVQLSAQQGETLAAGLASPTLIEVADLTRLEVDAFVDESDIGKIAAGMPATMSLDAFPGQIVNGKVVKIVAGSTIQQNVVTYQVTVSLPKLSLRLYPNMTATITIQTGKLSNVLLIPSVAINQGTNGSSVNVVRMVDGKQQFASVPVVTGGTDDTNTEVKSGLTEGETIVLAGMPKTGPQRGPSNPFGGGSGGGGRRG